MPVILVIGVVLLAFTLMMVQVTISEVARPELRATGLGGDGTALSAGLGIGPFIAGGVADVGGFGWGFGVIDGVGVGVAMGGGHGAVQEQATPRGRIACHRSARVSVFRS